MLELVGVTYNLIIQAVIIVFMLWFSFNYCKRHGLSQIIVFFLLTLHFSLTLITSYTSYGTTTDSPRYYNFAREANSWFDLFGLSTTFIKFLIYPLIKYLKMNYLSLFLIFSSFGIYGYLLLYRVLNDLEYARKIKILGVNVILIILFLPSFHFWMTFLGKDSIAFMFLMILLKDFIYEEQMNKWKYVFILLMITFIRPYLGVFIFIAVISALFFEKINSAKRILILLLIPLIGTFISFRLLDNLDINIGTFFSNRIETLSNYVEREGVSGSFLDPTKMNLLEKLFAYLYRPIFFDANGMTQLMISFENLFLFILSIIFLKKFSFKIFKRSFKIKLLLIFCLIFLIVKGYLIYNLGITNRHKYMIVPIFFYVLFFFINEKYRLKNEQLRT